MGHEDIVAELKATKEIIVEAQNAITARKESQDSFSSNLKDLLEKAKKILICLIISRMRIFRILKIHLKD